MNSIKEYQIGYHYNRISYRKLCWRLFLITQSGTPEMPGSFDAKRLFGNLWWVDLKSFRAYCAQFDYEGTCDHFEPVE